MSTAATDGASGQALLRHLLDESPSPLLALNEHGCVVDLNAAAVEALGRRRRSLLGKPLASLIELSDRHRFRAALADVLRSAPRELELLLGTASGRRLAFRLRALTSDPPTVSVLLGQHEGGRPAGPEAPARGQLGIELERVLSRLPLAVIGLDGHGTLVFANARARLLFADTPLRRGKPLPDLGSAFSHRRLPGRRTLVTPPPEAVAKLADGRSFRLLAVAARGDLPGLLVFDDISSTLAEGEHERAFLRNAAHQIRTPLAGIANAVEVLQSGAKDDPRERDRFLEHIERESARLGRLTRSLLVLARAQAGVQSPRLELVPLQPLLSRLAQSFEASGQVAVEVSCGPRLAAFAEPDLLEEALAALIENAVRHTRGGTVWIRACARGERTEIEVEDSGEGIPPEHLDTIFDPFSRGDQQRDRFGLGLAIAREAVAAMDGGLQVRSEPARGTCFSFSLASAGLVERAPSSPETGDGSAGR